MGNLTLDQVREAGRFAWNPRWRIFSPETGVVAMRISWGSERGKLSNDLDLDPERCEHVIFSARELPTWHHLPGCDCPFCK